MCEESRIDKVVLQYIPVPYYSRLYKRCCVIIYADGTNIFVQRYDLQLMEHD